MAEEPFDFRALVRRLADDLPYSHRNYAALHGGRLKMGLATAGASVIADRHDDYDRAFFNARGLSRADDVFDNRRTRPK